METSLHFDRVPKPFLPWTHFLQLSSAPPNTNWCSTQIHTYYRSKNIVTRTKPNSVKAYRGVEIQRHAFLPNALKSTERSVQRAGCSPAEKKTTGSKWRGQCGDKNLCPCRAMNPIPPSPQLPTQVTSAPHTRGQSGMDIQKISWWWECIYRETPKNGNFWKTQQKLKKSNKKKLLTEIEPWQLAF